MQIAALLVSLVLSALSFVRAAPTTNANDLIVIEGFAPYNGTEHGLHERSTIDYSGVDCNSACGGTPGEGPNEADCVSLIQQKLFRAGEAKFTVQPNSGGQATYGSCVIALKNPSPNVVVYQFNLMGSVGDFLRQKCNAAHGASIGQCTFSDGLGEASPSVQVFNAKRLA